MKFKSNLDKFLQGFQKIIRKEMENAAHRTAQNISRNCPNPHLKGWFGSKVEHIPDGSRFEIFTTFPKPIAIYVTEFGRRGLPRRGGYTFPAGGYPLRIKPEKVRKVETIAGHRLVGFPSAMSRREREKLNRESIIIRPGPIEPVPPRPFIRPTWREEYSRLMSNLSDRIKELINRCEVK